MRDSNSSFSLQNHTVAQTYGAPVHRGIEGERGGNCRRQARSTPLFNIDDVDTTHAYGKKLVDMNVYIFGSQFDLSPPQISECVYMSVHTHTHTREIRWKDKGRKLQRDRAKKKFDVKKVRDEDSKDVIKMESF